MTTKKIIDIGSSIGIILIFLSIIAYACLQNTIYPHRYDKDLYQNFTGKIVAIGEQTGPTHDKFHKPVEYHNLLIQMQTDTTLFFEWETTSSKYYNFKVNQIVHFDYIRKDRTFKIN